jgi:hypothetical protein
MSQILINIDDVLIHELLSSAMKKARSLEDHINIILGEHIGEAINAEGEDDGESKVESTLRPNMLMVAVERAQERPPGDKFTLQELFPTAEEWAMVEQPRMFGRHFRGLMTAGTTPIARHVGVTKQNKAIYERQ